MTDAAPVKLATLRAKHMAAKVAKYGPDVCRNGGCCRVPRYRGTLHCYSCWVWVKWNSIQQRVRNRNGNYPTYQNMEVGFTRDEFVEWALVHRPPETMQQPSLDRIDNERGYVKGNIQWMEMRANARGPRKNVPLHLRVCPRCRRMLPLTTEHFHKRRAPYTMGFQSYCRKCRSEANYGR